MQCPDKITIHAAENKRHGQQGVNCKPPFLPQGGCLYVPRQASGAVRRIHQ